MVLTFTNLQNKYYFFILMRVVIIRILVENLKKKTQYVVLSSENVLLSLFSPLTLR